MYIKPTSVFLEANPHCKKAILPDWWFDALDEEMLPLIRFDNERTGTSFTCFGVLFLRDDTGQVQEPIVSPD